MSHKNFYATINLNRAANQRSDNKWVSEQLKKPESKILPVWRNQNLFIHGDNFSMACLDVEHLSVFSNGKNQPILLGMIGQTSYFSIDISHLDNPKDKILFNSHVEFADLRQIGQILNSEEGNLLAYARGINYWHQQHLHCGVCGNMTHSEAAGHQRRCEDKDCNMVHFPRTDSACIVLIHNDDKIILARAGRFPAKMQSVLAGFLEPGESLEDCVAREVFEEVGVNLTDIVYQHSQPWPFPSSLMVGFRARALNTDLHPDPTELESADWFSRDELKAITPESDLQLPRLDSIARRLIEEWLAEE
jgi:NAD+ diphosphatase